MSMLGLDPLEVVNTPPLKQTPSYSNVNTGMLEKERLSGGGFSVGQDFVNRDLAAREQGAEQTAFTFGIGEDVAGYDKDYLSGDFADRINMSGQNQLQQNLDVGTEQRLGALGLQRVYEQDKYKGYKYNPTTGDYDYYDNTPSMIDTAMPVLIKQGITMAVTAGLGSALGGAMGSSIAGKATAAGVASLAQGNSPKDALLSAATAGFGEYAKGAQAAAQAADATQAVKNTAQTLDTIRKTVNVAQAVSSGNTVGAILGGMDLMGLPSVTSMVSDKLTETFPDSDFLTNPDNLEAVSNSLTKFGTKLASGEDPQKALASAMWDYIQSDGAMPSLNIDIDLGEGWDTPEWMRQIDSEALQPIKDAIVAGYQVVNENVLNPIQEIGSAASSVVREAGRDVREAVDPYADVVREAGRDVREAVSGVDVPSINLPDLPDFTGSSGSSGYAGSTDPLDLVTVSLDNPELVRGFDLSNPFLR
jgi:hypothetical protein